jgi:hypothetical protein
MTYTPGPWTIDHQRIGPPGEPVALLCDVNDPMTGTVIDWPRGNDSGTAMSIDDAENEANARLIASAPDLMRWLQSLMDRVSWGDPGFDALGEIVVTFYEYEELRAAIDKATTGQKEEL